MDYSTPRIIEHAFKLPFPVATQIVRYWVENHCGFYNKLAFWADQAGQTELGDEQVSLAYRIRELDTGQTIPYSGDLYLGVLENDLSRICVQSFDDGQQVHVRCEPSSEIVLSSRDNVTDAQIKTWLDWRAKVFQAQFAQLLQALDYCAWLDTQTLPNPDDPVFVAFRCLRDILPKIEQLQREYGGETRIVIAKPFGFSAPKVEIEDWSDLEGGQSKLTFSAGSGNAKTTNELLELDRRAFAVEVYNLIRSKWPDALRRPRAVSEMTTALDATSHDQSDPPPQKPRSETIERAKRVFLAWTKGNTGITALRSTEGGNIDAKTLKACIPYVLDTLNSIERSQLITKIRTEGWDEHLGKYREFTGI